MKSFWRRFCSGLLSRRCGHKNSFCKTFLGILVIVVRSLYLEWMWPVVQYFTNFTASHFISKWQASQPELFVKIPPLPFAIEVILTETLPKNMTSIEKLKIWSGWKFPFCDHVTTKLTQNFICFINPCINLLLLRCSTCEYHHKLRVKLLNLQQCITVHLKHILSYISSVKENLAFIGTKFPHLDTSVKSLHGFGS